MFPANALGCIGLERRYIYGLDHLIVAVPSKFRLPCRRVAKVTQVGRHRDGEVESGVGSSRLDLCDGKVGNLRLRILPTDHVDFS